MQSVVFGVHPTTGVPQAVKTDGNGVLQTSGSGGGGGGGGVSQGAVTTAAPTYTTGTNQPLSVTTGGLLRTEPTQPALSEGADRSGTATTTAGQFTVPANASRKSLVGQNVSSVVIGFNEFNTNPVIGSPGTYTVPPGAPFSISTRNAVRFVAASGTAGVTMTET